MRNDAAFTCLSVTDGGLSFAGDVCGRLHIVSSNAASVIKLPTSMPVESLHCLEDYHYDREVFFVPNTLAFVLNHWVWTPLREPQPSDYG